jgi:hypothetical protein
VKAVFLVAAGGGGGRFAQEGNVRVRIQEWEGLLWDDQLEVSALAIGLGGDLAYRIGTGNAGSSTAVFATAVKLRAVHRFGRFLPVPCCPWPGVMLGSVMNGLRRCRMAAAVRLHPPGGATGAFRDPPPATIGSGSAQHPGTEKR